MPSKLTLATLTCAATEDWLGHDECKLEVVVDGAPALQEKHSMGAGSIWVLNKEVQFNSSVEVKLWDEDNPPIDPDDLLGRHVLTLASLPAGFLAFTEDDASYTLAYSLLPALPGGGLPDGTLPDGALPDPTLPDGGVLPPLTLSPEQLRSALRLVGGFLVGALFGKAFSR